MQTTQNVTKIRQSSHSSLDIYLEQIKRYALLSREEETDLARRAQAGHKPALDRLVQSNLRFVVSVAKKYAGHGVPLEDLVNDGNMGLVKAAQKFDPERGVKFISYAVWWIRQAVLQSLSRNSRMVRLPFNRSDAVLRVGRASRELDQSLGRTPTSEEIAEHLGIGEAEVIDTMRINTSHVSLDVALSDEQDDNSFLDYLEDQDTPAPDHDLYKETLGEDMARALDTLPERERVILDLYFGIGGKEPLTLEQIGQHLGYTRERIRQLKEQALERIRTTSRSQYLAAYMEN